MVDTLPKSGWFINSSKFHVQRVDMVINPPWNLPFLGAKGLTSPEQTATGPSIEERAILFLEAQDRVKKGPLFKRS
ncbi:hypothetical protein Tco_0249126 [Tanacetum coccineum]